MNSQPKTQLNRAQSRDLQKARIRPSAFALGRWQCRGGPMRHGEYLTGYGATPNEAWLAWRVKALEYEAANSSLLDAIVEIWREVDGNIDETAREILVHTDNARGNEIRESCGRIEEVVNRVLESV